MKNKSKITNLIITLWIIISLAVLIVLILPITRGYSCFSAKKILPSLGFTLVCLLVLIIIGILSTVQFHRNLQDKKTTILSWVVLGIVALVSFWLVNYESGDWRSFLVKWCEKYQAMNWQEAMRNITNVSDYVPFYNYFLIFFVNVFDLQGCLYAVKTMTFLFSVLMSVVMELIVCHIRQSKFNYLHLACFLLLPPVLLEFTAWGQCDAIYTAFALLAFYFALKHKSVLCFISLGLAFAIKLQFLFIAPIILVMLIIRDQDGKKYLSWKWVWLAPCMYAVNFVPLFFGGKFLDLIMIYFKQTGSYAKPSSNCLNLPILLNWIDYLKNDILNNVVSIVFALIGITVTIILLVLVLRANRRQTLTKIDLVRYALCFAMVMVYFMPRMHERFYFMAAMLSAILLLLNQQKMNQLICNMIITGLTMSVFVYLIFNGDSSYHNGLHMTLMVTAQIIGWVVITLSVIGLLVPVIQDEIKAHDKLTKANN